MKFTNSALATALAIAATHAPTSVHAWNMGGPSPFCASPMILSSPAVEVLRRQQAMVNRAHQLERQQFDQSYRQLRSPFQSSWSPSRRFEITEDDRQVQIAVDVPGVKLEDIDISLEDNILTIRGQRALAQGRTAVPASDSNESKEMSSTFGRSSSKFSQSFSLNDPTIVVEEITANLENGVLIVAAPKDIKRIENNIRKIPIKETSSATASSSPEVKTMADVIDDSGAVADDSMQSSDDALQEGPNKIEAKDKDSAPKNTEDN